MKGRVVQFVVVIGLVLLPVAASRAGSPSVANAAGSAQAGLLTGEIFQPSTMMVTGGSGCQPIDLGNATFSFTATGVATGPVPGTYTETGSFTIGLDTTTGLATVLQFDAKFQIVSGGHTVATGTKTLAASQPPTSFGVCFDVEPNVDAMLDYTATVNGNDVEGQAEAQIGPDVTNLGQSTFQETFLSSTTVSCFTSIEMPFNGIAIPGNTYIWLPAIVQIHGQNASGPATITFTDQTLTLDGTTVTVTPPNGSTTFSPTTLATTIYDYGTNTWMTNIPQTVGGKSYLTGVEIKVPASGLPGGIKPVTWSGQIGSDTPGLDIHWQWGAAVYSSFSTDYNSLGVKPVDDPTASIYLNGDNAGTPENFKQYVTGGARGGGGNNYTGSWSAVGMCRT